MFKKGRKREAKGLAVVYFIIGLIILLIILAVIYFALVELDYSDRMKDPDATVRSYVEMTPEPQEIEAIEDEETEEESPLPRRLKSFRGFSHEEQKSISDLKILKNQIEHA